MIINNEVRDNGPSKRSPSPPPWKGHELYLIPRSGVETVYFFHLRSALLQVRHVHEDDLRLSNQTFFLSLLAFKGIRK